MKNIILLSFFLVITAIAHGQSTEVNPRPIDSTEYDGKILNQMERTDGEGDETTRQEMEERPDMEEIDESMPGYTTPEEGYEEDVAW